MVTFYDVKLASFITVYSYPVVDRFSARREEQAIFIGRG